MQSTRRRFVPHSLSCLCFCLALVSSAVRAAGEPKDIVVPLDERLLAHLETTADHLAAKEKTDPALKKDFRACNDDKKISGDTPDAISSSITARHPRMTAALAAEGWKPGDFYLAFGTLATMPMASEFAHGGEPDSDKGVRRNVTFFDQHKARVLAVLARIGPLLGAAPAKN